MPDLFSYLLVSLFLIASYLLALMLAGWMFKQALRQVVEIFRSHGATTWNGAKTAHELDLAPRSFMQRLVRVRRDYKPQALRFLVHHRVVHRTDDDRIYLSEKDLINRLRMK
ncbi:MAG: hypothetical protein C4530_10945 [Desulfobacteraceae bacterium]|nr:MAG: hypothetical protein C4530_10945 [Desulfobacteraceae bacterium]